jgi:hypothetical protein
MRGLTLGVRKTRGFLYRFLMQSDIQIDQVSGTSAGAKLGRSFFLNTTISGGCSLRVERRCLLRAKFDRLTTANLVASLEVKQFDLAKSIAPPPIDD